MANFFIPDKRIQLVIDTHGLKIGQKVWFNEAWHTIVELIHGCIWVTKDKE